MTHHGLTSVQLQSDLKNLKPLLFFGLLNGLGFKTMLVNSHICSFPQKD